MLMRLIYDDRLAQAAYLIGCQRTGEAIIFDPERDVDRYIALAAKEGLKIAAVAETHIHADFLSGARELAEQTGAKVYVSGEGGRDWQSEWVTKRPSGGAYTHQILKHNDTFKVGNIEFRALHTPGHTPEHVCYLVTDRGGGAGEPMGVITGDFVFVGDLGRPDLLETAAGQEGAKEPSARALYKSVIEFQKLPEWVQVWPAHGAGSACGKSLGAVPQSTVGYEKRFNPAILASAGGSEQRFIAFILEGQPEPPMYFARMKRENKLGPRVLGQLPKPEHMIGAQLMGIDTRNAAVIDTRPWADFRAGHLPGSLFAPQDNMFHPVVGSYVKENEPIYLLAPESKIDGLVRDLVRIGLDNIQGWISPESLREYAGAGGKLAASKEIDVGAARDRMASGGVFMLDVRRADEFAAGHLPKAMHAAYPRLPERLAELPKGTPILVNCRSGGRSARAVAYLQRLGYDATNIAGGFLAWEKSGAPIEGKPGPCGSAGCGCATR